MNEPSAGADNGGESAGEGRAAPVVSKLLKFFALHPLLFFTGVALLLVGPHVFPPTKISHLSYDAPDAVIRLWNFWWTKTWITGLHNPFWTDLLYHPFGTSLAAHGYALPYSILLSPLQAVLPGMTGLVVSFNIVVFASFVLSGFGAYRLAEFATGHRLGSLLAGLVFAFMPFHFLNMARFYQMCVEFMPLYVVCLLALWETPSRRRAVWLAGSLALCFYTSLEHALYLVLFSAFWFVYVSIADRARFSSARLVALAQASVLFLVLAGPLLLAQARLPATTDNLSVERQLEEVVDWSPALLSFITPSRSHPLYADIFSFAGEYPDRSHWGMRSETSVGLMTWLLAAFALPRLRRSGAAFWFGAASLLLLLTLGPQLRVSGSWLTEVALPYRWLYEAIPPLRGSRDPSRIFPLAMLMLSVLVAFGTRALLERRSERQRVLLGSVLIALVVFESLTVWRSKFAPILPPVYQALAAESERGPIADLSKGLVGLLGQTVHGRPIGYVWGIALRGAPLLQQFEVERSFLQPGRSLGLEASERRRSLDSLRAKIVQRPVELLLLPPAAVSKPQRELARRLAAGVSSQGKYLVVDFSELQASKLPRRGAGGAGHVE